MEETHNKKEPNWERWFLITLSLLLIVIFALYLPTWFALKSADLDNIHEEESSMGMDTVNVEEDEDHPHDDSVDPNHAHEKESSVWVNIVYAAEHEDHPHDDDVDSDHTHGALSDEGVPWYRSSQWWIRFLVSAFFLVVLSFVVKKYITVK